MTQQELGILGEELAAVYLQKKHYKIIARNFRFGHLEADLICEADGQLIVVEVKARQTAAIGEPWRAVTRTKQKQIIRVANHYIHENDVHLDTRFDIVSIVHDDHSTHIEHIEDAFSPLG